VLITICIVLGIAIVNWDKIIFEYEKIFWEPDSEMLGGVSIGDTRSDVIFRKGEPDEVDGRDITYDKNGILSIMFNDDDTVEMIIYTGTFPSPFDTVDKMKEIIGDEDILAISKDFRVRRYTYLQWGVSFLFLEDVLRGISIGTVQWRSLIGGGYIVKGRVICPGDDCIYDDDGEIKLEYEDKDYRIFISQ